MGKVSTMKTLRKTEKRGNFRIEIASLTERVEVDGETVVG